jgi:IS1 family transposase
MLAYVSIIVQFTSMNQLDAKDRSKVVSALVEGNSIRATSRMTGIARNTVDKLLRDLGRASAIYQDQTFRNLSCKRLQCDEIWSFCYAKAKNVSTAKAAPEGAGDIWTWTAIDADSKLVPCWFVGARDANAAYCFMYDLSMRMAHRIQLTTDGLNFYLAAIGEAFGTDVDYAMLVKIYGEPERMDARYSPAQCVGAKKAIVRVEPEVAHISTSFVERQNLTMRMSMRRFTRLTNGFSKKIENHEHAIAIHYMYYNFCRIHQTLRVTPAMQAGVADHVWELSEIVALVSNESGQSPN